MIRKNILAIVSCFIFIISCSSPSTKKEETKETPQPGEVMPPDTAMESFQRDTVNHYLNVAIEVKTFKNQPAIGGYGYDIIMAGKTYIHQTNIPAVPGNAGFSTEDKARKAAELMVHKIRNNIMPPALEVRELDSLGLLK